MSKSNNFFIGGISMNSKCYAIYCDHNNIDCTCMYGDTSKMKCQVNCYNCKHNCKKSDGDRVCKNFSNLQKNIDI